MVLKPILNSPGYYVSDTGYVYNKDKVRLKTFLKSDGYKRICLYSLKHKKRVNRTVHLLVTEAFLNNGNYVNKGVQVNHKDGNKLNNSLSNLEIVTGTENVNHAHNNGLYTFDLKVRLRDTLTGEMKIFRSIREAARYFKLPLNVLKPRIRASMTFPLYGRYSMSVNLARYHNRITKLKGNKLFYVYDYVSNRQTVLYSYSQISILYGIPSVTISKILRFKQNVVFYKAGYSFSLNKITIVNNIDRKTAIADREKFLKDLITNTDCRIQVDSKR